MKIVCFLLVAIFSINIAGCGYESNKVPPSNIENSVVGVGSRTVGYRVYSQSTFDPMTEELFMGYLLSGRAFTLVVVPGTKDGDDYVIKTENGEATNYLFNAAFSLANERANAA